MRCSRENVGEGEGEGGGEEKEEEGKEKFSDSRNANILGDHALVPRLITFSKAIGFPIHCILKY
jgi:hypothetical protein